MLVIFLLMGKCKAHAQYMALIDEVLANHRLDEARRIILCEVLPAAAVAGGTDIERLRAYSVNRLRLASLGDTYGNAELSEKLRRRIEAERRRTESMEYQAAEKLAIRTAAHSAK